MELVEHTFNKNGRADIIDIGGTKEFWDMLPDNLLLKNNMHITIVNLKNITIPENNPFFSFVQADACDLSGIKDKSFHISHSNSVIEHVGGWKRMIQFAKEISRVAECYFVQTPCFWFPVEPHCMTLFYHWLPKKIRVWLILHFSLGHWRKAKNHDEALTRAESIFLLDKRKVAFLFSDAKIQMEKFLWFSKSIIAIRKCNLSHT